MILFDWKCPRHGVFESSHPICDALGCDSEGVVKVFLKAPGLRSETMKRFDAGIRRSSDMMNISNFRSAKAGEAAYGGDAAKNLLWGRDAEKFTGKTFAELQTIARASEAKTPGIPNPIGQVQPAMPVVAPAERTGVLTDLPPNHPKRAA